MNLPKITAIAAAVLTTVAVLSSPFLFENLDSRNMMVIQYPITGSVRVITEPGWAFQGLGSVTTYPRRREFTFQDASCLAPEHVKEATRGLNIRFYDGGNAILCGSMSWMMPTDTKSVYEIHRDFGSSEAFETQALRRSMEAAATFSGPTMTAFDSAAGKRNDLLSILNDQTLHGLYKTAGKKVMVKDVTGAEKEVTVLEIVIDSKTGQPIRAQDSYVSKYKVTMLPMTINNFKYEKRVEDQIQDQQKATNAAVVSAANARKADQDAITAESVGKANAATAKWKQEVENATTVALAQAKVLIADASVKEAEAFKRAEILRGQGEAERKRLVMEADGALDKKLEAIVQINAAYAENMSKAQPGAWTPQIVMGGNGSANGNQATNLIELLTAKTAKDLGIDLAVKGATATKK